MAELVPVAVDAAREHDVESRGRAERSGLTLVRRPRTAATLTRTPYGWSTGLPSRRHLGYLPQADVLCTEPV